jgi:hypothetical protein
VGYAHSRRIRNRPRRECAYPEKCLGVGPQEALDELLEIWVKTVADGGAEVDVPQGAQVEDEVEATPGPPSRRLSASAGEVVLEEREAQEPVGYDPDRPTSPWDEYCTVMEDYGYGYY